jgi:hypothetical protein
MSIFPRHVSPGQTATIHLRVAVAIPCFPLAYVAIRDPHGTLMFEDTRHLLGCVPAAREPSPTTAAEPCEGLREATPLLLLAQHLRQDAEERVELMTFLQDMAHSRHTYWQFCVPEDAALGCYTVELGVFIEGQMRPSLTAASDRVFVERLSLERCETTDQGVCALVRNHSPLTTHARLHEYSRGLSGLCSAVRVLELPPTSTSELHVAGERALLSYAEGNAALWLTPERERGLIREPSCAFMIDSSDRLVVTRRFAPRSFTLTGPARAIWQLADGVTRRADLEAVDGRALRALIDAGLLRAL